MPHASEYVTKDSGERAQLANGMVRDTEDGKPDYTLVLDGPMFKRWVGLLGRGAKKYKPRNWCKALAEKDPVKREETKARFLRSAFRHFVQWICGEVDEDHAAAVIFNINGYEAMVETDLADALVDLDDKMVTEQGDPKDFWRNDDGFHDQRR